MKYFPYKSFLFFFISMFQEKEIDHTKLVNHIPYKLQEAEWSNRNP